MRTGISRQWVPHPFAKRKDGSEEGVGGHLHLGGAAVHSNEQLTITLGNDGVRMLAARANATNVQFIWNVPDNVE